MSDPGAYTWADPRFNDPNWTPPNWVPGIQTGPTPPPPIPNLALPPAAPIVAPAPAPPPLSPGLAGGQQDAFDALQATLAAYGLGTPEMLAWVKQQIIDNVGQSTIMLALHDPKTVPGRIVDQMYPELRGRRDAHLRPISIAEAVSYRDNAVQMMRAAGFPKGFYDEPEDLARFQIRNVSLAELKSRIDEYTVAATSAPAETRAQLTAIYGIGAGGLAAYYADPDRALPVLEKQFAAASLSGAGVRAGFGGLNRTEAERLAGLGLSDQQATQGFGALVENREVVNQLPGERAGGVSREQQLAAVFGGDEQAMAAIERRRRARQAVFGGRGGLSVSQAGVGGLGSAAS